MGNNWSPSNNKYEYDEFSLTKKFKHRNLSTVLELIGSE